jgi:hypothetical protein
MKKDPDRPLNEMKEADGNRNTAVLRHLKSEQQRRGLAVHNTARTLSRKDSLDD